MAKQGFTDKAAGAAYNAMAIKNIISAFMQGGWGAAALQALKYYWPQILTIAFALILIPLIIISCFPMMMFGFDDSTDPQITEMSVQAEQVEAYFEKYDQYCEARMNQINTETAEYRSGGYATVSMGSYISRNWFIALFSVSIENNYTNVTELQVMNFVDSCIVYEIIEEGTNNTAIDENIEITNNTVLIKMLSPEEIMDRLNFGTMEREWAALLHSTLESEETNGTDSIYSN